MGKAKDFHFDKQTVRLGQFFLEDEGVLKKIVESASIGKNEVVLEIGAGDGRMTALLANKAKKVIAVEIDEKFKPVLEQLPKNVEVVIGDALEYLSSLPKVKINKIIGNLPSTLVEPLFPKLIKVDFQLAVFLVPEKFAYKLENHPVFGAYYEVRLIDKVSKKSFSPVPRTNWEIISVTKVADPLESGKVELFLIRYIYEHPKAKLKNSLVEGIIKIFEVKGKSLTKNQAREIMAKEKIGKEFLESSKIDFTSLSEFITGLGKKIS